MKVIGQLERAQLENAAGTGALPGPASTGRVMMDTTNPAQAVPRVYNGSTWMPMLTGQTTPLIQQTSSGAAMTVTVNWATGLNQEVILGAHTTIQFTNPQAGQIHTLLVTQRATEASSTTPWMYNFNFPDQYTRRLDYIQKGCVRSSESHTYSWFYSAGVKPGYATVPATSNGMMTTATNIATGIAVHPKFNQVYTGRQTTPFLAVTPFFDDCTGARWGTYAGVIGTMNAFAGVINSVAITPDGDTIFCGGATTPFLQGQVLDGLGYPSNVNVLFTNPATLPAGSVFTVAVHPSGSHVVCGHATTPFMSCYPIVASGFSTKIANPATTLPAAQVNALAWSPTGDFLAVASQTSPFLQVYSFDPYTGFGATPVASPATLPTGGPGSGVGGHGVAWNPAGTWIALAMSTAPYLYMVPFNRQTGTFGTAIASITVPFFGNVTSVAFSPCGNYLIAGGGGNQLAILDTSSLPALGPLGLNFDAGAPSSVVNDIALHPSGEYFMCAQNATPYLYICQMPRKTKNYLKLNI
jgi:WD domain, G-beta repeat